jgi:putative ABC transport system ATP-binding protein
MTVLENFALTLQKGKIPTLASMITVDKKEKIILELNKFNLQHLIDTPMKDLSGGQRQLLAFIMATMTNPQLLLLDEPTAALDPSAATTLLKTALLYNKIHKLTTILITHDPEIALAIANKIWILNNGSIIKEYTHDQIYKIKADDLIGHINYDELKR